MNVSWVARDEDEPDERVVAWAERTGCDSWILVAEESDPLGHAAGWNSHLQSDPEAYGAALDEWARYLDELGVRWVSDGAVILKRRSGGERGPVPEHAPISPPAGFATPWTRSTTRSTTCRLGIGC